MSHKNNKLSLPMVKETCFESIEKMNCSCKKNSCKQWIPYEKGNNCVLVTTRKGPLTLREIGDIYGLTRMRICQIEKKIYKKIRDHITDV